MTVQATYTKALEHFINSRQLQSLESLCQGEEGEYYINLLETFTQRIKTMPGPNGQSKKPDPTMYLHYFYGGCDWYIMEKDTSSEQHQAFGYARLGGMEEYAELGYISLTELFSYSSNGIGGVELDLHFTPQPLSKVKASLEAKDQRSKEVETSVSVVPMVFENWTWSIFQTPVTSED